MIDRGRGAEAPGQRVAGLLVLVMAFVPALASALDGRLVDPEGSPLPGARVVVIGFPGSAVSNREGNFRLPEAPAPPFRLLVTRPDGVAMVPITVTEVPASGRLVVTVRPAFTESVTVISGVVPDLELPPAAAATILGRGDLDLRTPDSLPQVLEDVPGATQVGEGHAAVPALRGFAKGRTLILLDEGRVTAERRAGPSASFVDPATIEEVEIVRGPGSVAYGSDAFGGVIRLRSRVPDPGESFAVRYSAVGTGATGEAGAVVEASGTVLGGGLLVGAHQRHFDDYRSPHGVVPDSGAELSGYRLAYQVAVGAGLLRLDWRDDRGRDIGKPAVEAGGERTQYPVEDSRRFGVVYQRPGPAGWDRLAVSAAWDRYTLVLDRDRPADGGEPRRLRRAEVEAQDYDLRLEAERRLGENRLVLGANAYGRFALEAVNRTELFGPSGDLLEASTELSVVDAESGDVGVFAGLGREIGRVRVAGGVRADRVGTSNRGGHFGDRSTTETALSGFVAATVPVGAGLELTAQLARGFRAPLLSDRYYRGVTGRGFITGNPDLEAETSHQCDLALRATRGRLQVAGFAYLYRVHDLVERYRDGADYFFRNRGVAEIRGLELELSAALGAGFELQLGAQALRGEVRDDHSALDDIPALGGFAVLRGRLGEPGWWLLRLAVKGRDRRPGPTESVVPGLAVVDAGFGWSLGRGLELQFLGRNLLDHPYPASADAAAVLAPGRSVQVVLRGGV